MSQNREVHLLKNNSIWTNKFVKLIVLILIRVIFSCYPINITVLSCYFVNHLWIDPAGECKSISFFCLDLLRWLSIIHCNIYILSKIYSFFWNRTIFMTFTNLVLIFLSAPCSQTLYHYIFYNVKLFCFNFSHPMIKYWPLFFRIYKPIIIFIGIPNI
jgi:hypothetical protein